MMYKCVIFDLDGTLQNTIHALTYSTNRVLEKLELSLVDEEMVKKFVGNGYRKLVERAVKNAGVEESKIIDEACRFYEQEFEKHCLYQVEPYEGIRALLTYLKENHIKTAVCTNKSQKRAEDTLEHSFGKDCFDMIVGEREGQKKKPDPEGVFLIMETFHIKPEECLYIGDSDTDMKTGINANVDTVGAAWGFRGKEELMQYSPKYIAASPFDILKILKEQKEKE